MSDKELISSNQMIVSVEELKEKGLSLYKINQLVEQGFLRKLNKKFYENTNFQGDESDFYYAYAYVPFGVICLMSAAVFYDLTTYRPEGVDVAIQRKARVSTLPDWPEIQLYYYTDDRYELGIETIEDGRNRFHIYNVEKTVVEEVEDEDKDQRRQIADQLDKQGRGHHQPGAAAEGGYPQRSAEQQRQHHAEQGDAQGGE